MGGRGKGIGGNTGRSSFESIDVSFNIGSGNTISEVETVLLLPLNAGTLQFAILTVEGLINLSPILHTHFPVVRFHRFTEFGLLTSSRAIFAASAIRISRCEMNS